MGIADLAVWGHNARARKICNRRIAVQLRESAGRARTTVSNFLSIDAARKGAADA
jgi:hypothetical protein